MLIIFTFIHLFVICHYNKIKFVIRKKVNHIDKLVLLLAILIIIVLLGNFLFNFAKVFSSIFSIIKERPKYTLSEILLFIGILFLIFFLKDRYNTVHDKLIYTIPDNQKLYSYNLKYEFDDISDSLRSDNFEVYLNEYYIWLGEDNPTTIDNLHANSLLNLKIHHPIYKDGSYLEIDYGKIKISTLIDSKEYCWDIDDLNDEAIGICFNVHREVSSSEVWTNLFK